jgi:hypothetical protein
VGQSFVNKFHLQPVSTQRRKGPDFSLNLQPSTINEREFGHRLNATTPGTLHNATMPVEKAEKWTKK